MELPFSRQEYLVLDRSKEARPYRLVPIGDRTAEIGKPLEVPGSGGGTDLGRNRDQADIGGETVEGGFQSPERSSSTLNWPAAQPRHFSFVPEMAGAGFLLSPLVSTCLGSVGWRRRRGAIRTGSVLLPWQPFAP